ncbi:MAG: hypothetical protein ABJA71_02725, partial [Ginsengibacter sp.]
MSNQLQQDHFKVKPKDHNVEKKISLPGIDDYSEISPPSDGGDLEVAAPSYLAGRGAQINTKNKFLKNQTVKEHIEAIDDWEEPNSSTQYMEQEVKSIVNKIDSPDLSMMYSMNPYAGCEHGCIYCYARNVHEYWGYSAGL